jgi:hypothetical protein
MIHCAPRAVKPPLERSDERRGDRDQASFHYNRFIELWSNADPNLRSQVTCAEERLAALAGE